MNEILDLTADEDPDRVICMVSGARYRVGDLRAVIRSQPDSPLGRAAAGILRADRRRWRTAK